MTSILLRNGVVHSDVDPFAESVLVDDGVIAWTGSNDTADGLADRVDRVVDLDGALVAPGFVDAHVHLLGTGRALTELGLSERDGVRSAADVLERVAARVRAAPDVAGQGRTLVGHGWDESAWDTARPPTRTELDSAAGGAPVVLVRADSHSSLVSSAFAAATGLERMAGWAEDGIVTGAAHRRVLTELVEADAGRHRELTDVALRAAARRGIVSVHEQSYPASDTREGLADLLARTAAADSALPQVVGYRGELCADGDAVRELVTAIPGLTGIGGDLGVDGSLGSRTAALREPYADVPGSSRGELYLGPEQIAAHVAAVSAAGLQAGFHVIGDRAADAVLAGFRAAADDVGAPVVQGSGHRLEHAEMLDAAAIAELVPLGIRLSMQPAFEHEWGGPGGMYAHRLGAHRAEGLNPFAALATTGIPVAFGSDSPVTALDPWLAVGSAMGHSSPAQRISARAAFRAHTRGGWRLAGLEHTGAGQLRVGAPAHLAVWRAEHLLVQGAAGSGTSAWSTDARSGTPLLPELGPQAAPPRCVLTLRAGLVLHDELD